MLSGFDSGSAHAEDRWVDDSRLLKMEERIAWLEKHVIEQDKVMMRMVEEHDAQKRILVQMRERILSSNGGADEPGSPADERPPHY